MKIRVLHVIESLGMGGAERHLANLLRPLSELGVENEIAHLWAGSGFDDGMRAFAKIHDLGLKPRRALPALPRLVMLARTADVVHTQLAWADITGRLAAIWAQRPSVSTLQSTFYDSENRSGDSKALRRRIWLARRLDALTGQTTQRFFAVSDAVRRTYISALGLPPERVEIIPNTVDLSHFSSDRSGRIETRARLGLAGNERMLLTVARLVPSKRHEDAIAAVAMLRHDLPVKLFLAGVGTEEGRLRALARELQAPVVFLGARSDVPELLAAADLFVFATEVEGLPLALIEAMACGTPCLCSDIPENRETAADAVEYTPTRDVPALAAAMQRLLQDESRRAELSKKGPPRAERFSARSAAVRVLRSIEEVVASYNA